MRYVSLLRGINVSGQKKIRMNDLRVLYEKAGFQNVATYIQSGNVIFDSDIKSIPVLKEKIENTIYGKYKFNVPVELRTNRELLNIIKNCPYGPVDPVEDGTKILITFLSSRPLNERFEETREYTAVNEKIILKGKELYLYCPDGYSKSKLSNSFIEKKLSVTATTRNWKSVLNLYDLSR